jgi:hypothetical protein
LKQHGGKILSDEKKLKKKEKLWEKVGESGKKL